MPGEASRCHAIVGLKPPPLTLEFDDGRASCQAGGVGVAPSVVHDERQALRATLEAIGPDAASLCSPWTAADIAAHVVGGEVARGVPSYLPRRFVARGVRIGGTAVANQSRDVLLRRLRRKGFEWSLARLEAPPPRLLRRGTPGLVTLFETWVHHEDVRRANGMGADPEREYPELRECLDFVYRYQRKLLGGACVGVELPDGNTIALGTGEPTLIVRASLSDVLLWLAGRGGVTQVDVVGGHADIGGRLRI